MHYGKSDRNDKEYEKLCVEIIKFLFQIEFTKMSEQNSTEDKMFRMDLVCGIKAVLRNVAIIISRNGFSHNALKAATGILTENGKLIIDLNDNDIITMLRLKADKQDPSDYMLNKLEEYLMSISK